MTVVHYKGGYHPGNDLGLHYTALPPIVASCPYSDQLLVTRKFWNPGANRPSQARSFAKAQEARGDDSQPTRGSVMNTAPGRRVALMTMGLGMVAGATGFAALRDGAASAAEPPLLPPGAQSLEELTARLSRAPRRRDFKSVPMILNDPALWDHVALSEVIAYRGAPRQVWDNTAIAGAWMDVMRNSL